MLGQLTPGTVIAGNERQRHHLAKAMRRPLCQALGHLRLRAVNHQIVNQRLTQPIGGVGVARLPEHVLIELEARVHPHLPLCRFPHNGHIL